MKEQAPKRLQHYEYTTMDAALKAVEALVTRGYQVAIAPSPRGYSVSAPDRHSHPPVHAPTEGAAA